MRKLLFFLGFICVTQFSLAQSISGFVLFSKDKSPVEYGSVVLQEFADSSFVTGVITYSEGQYTLENVKSGNYLIKSSYMGYKDSYLSIEVIDAIDKIVADTIYLFEESSTIEEVQVTADYIRGKELVDRTVYSIPPEIAKSSTNGYEVLRKLPSVQVDFNNNITLNGSSNFIIQVDGKQRDKEFLARLSPEDIKSVELIHNPSGKYDGSIDGVINVILNSAARMGVSGNVALVVKPFNKSFLFGNTGLDYGREKITYYVSAYSFRQGLTNNTNSQYHFRGTSIIDSLINSKGEGDFSISASAINTGFDYYINEKNDLSFNYSFKPINMNTDLDNLGLIYVDEILAHEQKYINSNKVKSGESNASVFYKKKFEKPIQELTFESNVYWFNSDEKNTFATRLYPIGDPRSADSTAYLEKIANQRNYVKGKLDYVHPIGVSMRLETGYQLYYQKMLFNTEINNSLSNLYDYSELRNAVYLSWMWNIKDFGFMATIREEHSNILINDTASTSYFSFLPSLNIQYKINGSQNIKFTYNRRITRPNIYQLNPFEKLNNYQFISKGNPNLQPEHRDKLQLTYSINFKKNFISPHYYYTIITKKIGSINRLVDLPNSSNPIISSSPDNVLTGYEQGFGINSMLWFVKLDGKVFKGHYNEYNTGSTQIKAQNYYSYNLTGYVFAPVIKDKLTLYTFLMYQGVRFDAQSKTYSNPVYGLGGQYKLKNHTFSINYVFPFLKDYTYQKTVTETPKLYSEANNNFDVQYFVQFVYAYSFNKGKSVKKIGHKSKVESDSKSGGIGNQ